MVYRISSRQESVVPCISLYNHRVRYRYITPLRKRLEGAGSIQHPRFVVREYGGKCLKAGPPVKQQFRGNRSELSQELPRLDE